MSPSKAVTVTLVHSHATEPAEVIVRIKGGNVRGVQHTALAHEQLNAHNTFAEPDRVKPNPSTTAPRANGEEIRCVLPPCSVNRLDVHLV
jgi:alpha-L-arabinofuranosidase